MVLTALFSYINYRVLHIPTTIGVMFIALLVSLGLVALGSFGLDVGRGNNATAALVATTTSSPAALTACPAGSANGPAVKTATAGECAIRSD
jgi:hypothetical protein